MYMRWIEATVPSTHEDLDALCSRLTALGIESFSIEDEADFERFLEENRAYWDYVDNDLRVRFAGSSRIKFYLEDSKDGRAQLAAIQEALHREIEVRPLEDEDWENGWKRYYEPIAVGKRLLIVPEWMPAAPTDRVVLKIDPGIAFGTGSHATTRMCLSALEETVRDGSRVLDLGCGSGILGIAALLLGCGSVVGCDIDPKAPKSALHNAELNGIGADRFQAYAGDLLADEGMRRRLGGGYNMVLANIVADVIIPLSSFVRRFIAQGGAFLCSGIINERRTEVENALRSNGFVIDRHLSEDGWNCYICH